LENTGVDGRIILKSIFKKYGWGYGKNSSGSKLGQAVGCCECDNEHSGSITCGEVLD